MASRYDDLDASLELEQRLAADLRAALEPRGCIVIHHGTNSGGRHSPGGKPDIEVRGPDSSFLLLVEVTKRKSSSADGEFPAVTDHLNRAVRAGGYGNYGMLYVSPRTSARMSTNFRDLYNGDRVRRGLLGRIVSIDFEAAELLVDRLIGSDSKLYPASRFIDLIDRWSEATDDSRARQLVQQALFPEDLSLALDLREETREADALREKALKKQLEQVENKFRSYGITGNNANITLVYLAFIRLYEERRQRQIGEQNRFTLDGFRAWRSGQAASIQRSFAGRMVEFLLREIAEDRELSEAGLLLSASSEAPLLHQKLTDSLVETLILPVFDLYDFHTGRVDILGAVFETLARRGDKDTRVGQFFTPQQVVDFCADIVDLRPSDVVLDPAVGTARFLIGSMNRMVEKADEVGARDIIEVENSIRQRQLLGSDIDGWVATIAKMNMFIHGDGKSGIASVNGLALGDRVVFRNYPSGMSAEVDVVLTNPPLGETDYTVAAEEWEDLPRSPRSASDRIEYYEWLGVVPIGTIEDEALARQQDRIADVEDEISRLEAVEPAERPKGALQRAYKRRTALQLSIVELGIAVRTGQVSKQIKGRSMKGGALFIGAINRYLRPDRLPDELAEWQGGRTALIVDEAVLNTNEYSATRRFIRENFFIKAVVSLSRDAFKYLAHTDAKTSVLYLVKKPRREMVQREPVFYAHAERVGYSAVGNWVGDDLPQVALFYREFRNHVRSVYSGRHLDSASAASTAQQLPGHGVAFYAASLSEDPSARIDFFDARFRQRRTELVEKYGRVITLGDLVVPAGRVHPTPSRSGEYDFALVTRTGVAEYKDRTVVSYSPQDLWVLEAGTLVLSSIDLVKGAVAVADEDVAGLVMSKEMFAYRLRPDVDVDLHYLQLLLRSEAAKDMLLGFSTGTSNRTRLESPSHLLAFPLPPLPSKEEQMRVASRAREAYAMHRRAQELMRELLADAQEDWAAERDPVRSGVDTPIVHAYSV